jgi:adenosylcobyric acid synthase
METRQNTGGQPQGRCLAIFGTASDVGKSVVTTAICRILSDLGVRVAPFKSQNMSNNSFVTLEAGEIARAQFVQAEAARVEPSVHMNPVLLKPSSDQAAQVVLRGKSIGNRSASEYFSDTDWLKKETAESLDHLRSKYELVVIEGAGSCAEVNLRSRDFTNFSTAHSANAPVILVADIDRGGVFAQIIGTLAVIPEEDRRRVQGILINRFRGDPKLFEDGITWLEKQTGVPVLGLIPYYRHIEIDSEDSLPRELVVDPPLETDPPNRARIGVLHFPHISNFTDFACLARESVDLHYLKKPRQLSGYHALILPGSKNTRSDLEWLRDAGWEARIADFVAGGGTVIGICGGYQMLGESVADPEGVEGPPGDTQGLGLLKVSTQLKPTKALARVEGVLLESGERVYGYEIHNGVTKPTSKSHRPLLSLRGIGEHRATYEDGAIASEGRVFGCYLHGLFDSSDFRRAFLKRLAGELYKPETQTVGFRQRQYDLLADHFRRHMDVARLLEIAGFGPGSDNG